MTVQRPPASPSPALRSHGINTLVTRIATFAAAAATAALSLINVCSAVFQCGCRSWWSGAISHCNIHMPGPHCPWCMHGRAGYYTALLAVVVAQALVSFWPGRMKAVLRYVVAVAVFLAVAIAVAFVYGWSTGYWS